jgi:hypothetical protein
MLKNDRMKLAVKILVAAILCISFLSEGVVPRQQSGPSFEVRTPAISPLHHDTSIVTIEHKTELQSQHLSFSNFTFEEVRRGSICAITFLRLHFPGRATAGLMVYYFLTSQIFSSHL